MTRYYFHLWTGCDYEVDETGIELANADAAYLEAFQGAREICAELVGARAHATGYRFDVVDEQGRLVHDISFTEVLGERVVRRPAPFDWIARVNRGYALAADLAREIAVARNNLKTSRELLTIGPPYGASPPDVPTRWS